MNMATSNACTLYRQLTGAETLKELEEQVAYQSINNQELKEMLASHNVDVEENFDYARFKALLQKDLQDEDLRDEDLSGLKLDHFNLAGANLHTANLSGADLSKADLHSANLDKANLSEANLYGVNLSGATLIEADLSEANLTEANCIQASAERAVLIDATLTASNWNWASLRHASLNYAKANNISLANATMSHADVQNASLLGANLEYVQAQHSCWCNTDLQRASLFRADFAFSDLYQISVENANLTDCSCDYANLDRMVYNSQTVIDENNHALISMVLLTHAHSVFQEMLAIYVRFRTDICWEGFTRLLTRQPKTATWVKETLSSVESLHDTVLEYENTYQRLLEEGLPSDSLSLNDIDRNQF